MYKKIMIVMSTVILLLLAGSVWWIWSQNSKITNQSSSQADDKKTAAKGPLAPYTVYTSLKGVKIRIVQPLSGAKVSSPLTIKGQVPGSWSFEGTFPVRLTNEELKLIKTGSAKLDGNWMTDDYVPFTATIEFDPAGSKTGMLNLQKSNPSDKPENADSVLIDLKF
jgi:hypothetical protein